MLGRNIRKYRMLMGLSLRDMAKKLNVSHQTIKNYEENKLIPNSERLIQMSKIFNVNLSDLLNTFIVPELKFENFRKQSKLSKTKEKGLCMLISDEIAKYLEILDFANEDYSFDKTKWNFDVNSISDIDKIAVDVRKLFGISDDCALDNLTDKMEDNNFLILEINYEEQFDGFCEYINGLAFIILSSKGFERNRFTLAHELAHLILNFKEDLTEKEKEHYCNLFAASLLMPTKAMKKEFEFNNFIINRNVSINEIILIAKEYKVSMNAVIMRLYSLGIIDEYKKKNLFILLSKSGLRTKQLKIVDEHPTKKDKIIFRLEAEKIISADEAIKYLEVTTDEFFKSTFSN